MQHRLSEEHQGGDGDDREEQDLHPDRSGEIEEMQKRDGKCGNAEENHVEPAGSGELERNQDQPKHQPVPPLEGHVCVAHILADPRRGASNNGPPHPGSRLDERRARGA